MAMEKSPSLLGDTFSKGSFPLLGQLTGVEPRPSLFWMTWIFSYVFPKGFTTHSSRYRKSYRVHDMTPTQRNYALSFIPSQKWVPFNDRWITSKTHIKTHLF